MAYDVKLEYRTENNDDFEVKVSLLWSLRWSLYPSIKVIITVVLSKSIVYLSIYGLKRVGKYFFHNGKCF